MGELDELLNREILPRVTKPARYVNNELNAVRKDHSQVDVKVVLAFPDTYELGMSYLGYSILYHLLNRQVGVVAERVYAPWVDMEARLRAKNIPLFSLESKTPVRDFDVVGFTLQHELNYTNVLNMLDLAGIPLLSAERSEPDPLVIAGGPCAYNPEPIADFIDAVVIGDGEEVSVELVSVVRKWKKDGGKREDLLRALTQLEGVYVPSLYEVDYSPDGVFSGLRPRLEGTPLPIRARRVDRLAAENYPDKPLVSLTEITHDRLTLEIMRGCTRGCRFCHAGMTYRPLRERSIEDLLEQARRSISATGWEEISLLSLSTTDYGCLRQLVAGLNHLFAKKKVAISLPSLRPDSFTPELAVALQETRRTGLTFAPEAGTERLRRVINKEFDEETLLRAIGLAFENGWNLIKLYFMIGLPTEREDDLAGIVGLIQKALKLKKGKGGKGFNITISPFTPKAHTPFQWGAQDDVRVLREKIEYLRRSVPRREARLKWHNPETSLVEGVFSRGDRRLGALLQEAWGLGCKFDGWTDRFRFRLWKEAFARTGIDPSDYSSSRDVHRPLPWDHIHIGVSKPFLQDEWERALQAEPTPDCRISGCQGCGIEGCSLVLCEPQKVEAGKGVTPEPLLRASEIIYGRGKRKKAGPQAQLAKTRYRIEYAKGEEMRWISHLDLVRLFERAIRRADIPIAFSQGFHPHPKIGFGPPLPLGMTGEAEYVDLQLTEPYKQDLVLTLRAVLPRGLWISQAKPIFGKAESLFAIINLAEYEVDLSGLNDGLQLEECIASFRQKDQILVEQRLKDRQRRINLRAFVDTLELKTLNGKPIIRMRLKIGPQGTIRPAEVIENLLDLMEEESSLLPTHRKALYIVRGEQILTPMDVI